MAETSACRSHCQFITFITFLFTVNVIRQMAPLFSKVDSNKLWPDVQNEETVFYAKFGKDLFNISKVRPIGSKTKWLRFFGLPCMLSKCLSVRPSRSRTSKRFYLLAKFFHHPIAATSRNFWRTKRSYGIYMGSFP